MVGVPCLRPTRRAVDRWVRGAFLSMFLAWSFSRFGGESHPTHLPLTLAVGRQVYSRDGKSVVLLDKSHRFM